MTMAPTPVWQPPILEEFPANFERRRSQPALYECDGIGTATSYPAETGQQWYPAESVDALPT
jgi:hypothetical protein